MSKKTKHWNLAGTSRWSAVISACTVAASLDHRTQHMDGPPACTIWQKENPWFETFRKSWKPKRHRQHVEVLHLFRWFTHTHPFTHRGVYRQTLEHITHRHFYTQPFRHKRFYTQILLHTNAFTHRSFYTESFWTTEPFTHRHLTHRPFYTQTLLHTYTFTHIRFYTQTLLHANNVTHKQCYTQTMLHTNSVMLHTHTLDWKRIVRAIGWELNPVKQQSNLGEDYVLPVLSLAGCYVEKMRQAGTQSWSGSVSHTIR